MHTYDVTFDRRSPNYLWKMALKVSLTLNYPSNIGNPWRYLPN